MSSADEGAEGAPEPGDGDDETLPDAEGAEGAPEGGVEGPIEGGSDDTDSQPDIDPEGQASVPEGLGDIDPAEIEDAAGAGSDDDGDDSSSGSDEHDDVDDQDDAADGMEPEGGADDEPGIKAGEMYVTVVQSVTNAQIRKHGGSELERNHFDQYDLSTHFDRVMDEMGIGSDMAPQEALLLSTMLCVGDGLVNETDVLDKQMDRLMDKAMGAA